MGNIFDEALNDAEKVEISEVAKEISIGDEREARWKIKRDGKITSSPLPLLMKAGRGKDKAWGDTAITYLYKVKNSRRTGKEAHETFSRNFDWGHEQEPNAVNWLRKEYPEYTFKSCSDDFEEIIFKEPFPGFGDSPDFYVYKDDILIGVGEIKCPVDEGKIEKELDEKGIHDKQEYFWQDMGHLLGTPEAIELWHVTYDGYNDSGHVLKAGRECFADHLIRLEARIKEGDGAIEMAIRGDIVLSNINSTDIEQRPAELPEHNHDIEEAKIIE